MSAPLDLLRPGRTITGMSAILLPHRSSIEIDWTAFEAHVTRTAEAGLTPAVNMDTGFVHLLTLEQRAQVLSRTRSLGVDFLAGAFDEADVEAVQALGGTPVLFPSAHTADVVPAYQRVAESADRFIGFELSPVFHPDGRIWDLDTYRAVLGIPQCIGAKHSSLERQPEWDRLRLRDEVRPEFLVLTGNDLAIDMVMYGSDYLLGLSTFAPEEFAARDRAWAEGDIDGFHRRNDVLQWLGATAFRPPVPAYRHDAALFFQLRGWADSDATPEGAPRTQHVGARPPGQRTPHARGGGVAMRRRDFPQVKNLKNADAFLAHLDTLGISLPFADPPEVDTLAAPIEIAGRSCPNRFCILPMEGWDGTDDGRPTDLVRRRWSRFGSSGAGLVWGGEAFAVRTDGRANPRQLCLGPSSADDLAELHDLLDPAQVTGLQLTHSGRWSVEPRPGRADPLLDRRRTGPVLTPSELDDLVGDYVSAARLARDAGFDFVDVKACHGYLLHELLSGDGELAARAATMRTIIEQVRAEGIRVGVRLSVFDLPPHRPGADALGEPEAEGPWGFNDPIALIDLLGVDLLCTTAGSPYYCPHAQRPAWTPPSDGYAPPEDPLVGVARLLDSAASIAAARPDVTVVATGFSYLQEWLPHVASAMVRDGGAALVGIGRMALSYPDLPADVLAGGELDRKRLCRTFSDCTTAPRNGLVSGCYPLDPMYKEHPDRPLLVQAKKRARA